jgi:hypothetical protein
MKILRGAVAAAGALALLAQITSVEAQTKWRQLQPSGAGFRIEFPGTPKVTKDTVPSTVGPAPHLNAELFADGNVYVVDLMTYASPSPPVAVLDLLTSDMTKLGKVVARTELKVGPDVARRIEVEEEKGTVVITLLVTD